MSFSKPQVSFSSNFASLFSVMKDNCSIISSVKTLNTLHNRSKWMCKFWRLAIAQVNFHQILVIFETKNQFFFQILHQSSESWDITPLHFLAKILYTLGAYQSSYKFGEILREKSKVWNFPFDGFLLSKLCKDSAKNVQKSISHDIEQWSKV